MGTNPETLLKSLLGDTRYGSTDISLAVADFYAACGNAPGDFMVSAKESIDKVHSGMGMVRNANALLFSSWENDPGELPGKVEGLKRRIADEVSSASRSASSLFHGTITLATISSSSAVRSAIEQNMNYISQVYILESRPGLEGTLLGEHLAQAGVECTVLTDASVQYAAGHSDIILTGSDSVLGDGSLIHKAGTYPLFLAAREYSVPAYAITNELKFERQFTMENYPEFMRRDPSEITTARVAALNIYFDITPAALVTGYITGNGISGSGEKV